MSPRYTDAVNEAARLRRIRIILAGFMIGLALSGITAFPLKWELGILVDHFGSGDGGLATWLRLVKRGLVETDAKYPFLAYGTDWLAFGHVMIAIAFVGAWRNPVKNIWLFEFGLIACALVVPWAFVFGAVRGIPLWWRLIDCSFGVFGFIPLWYCRRYARELAGHPAGN